MSHIDLGIEAFYASQWISTHAICCNQPTAETVERLDVMIKCSRADRILFARPQSMQEIGHRIAGDVPELFDLAAVQNELQPIARHRHMLGSGAAV